MVMLISVMLLARVPELFILYVDITSQCVTIIGASSVLLVQTSTKSDRPDYCHLHLQELHPLHQPLQPQPHHLEALRTEPLEQPGSGGEDRGLRLSIS